MHAIHRYIRIAPLVCFCLLFVSFLSLVSPQSRASPDSDGVPIGGIGTGYFRLLSDGRIGNATINNNWSQPTGILPGCFAAASIRSGTRTTTHVLATANAYGLPTLSALDFDAALPQAKFTSPPMSFGDTEVAMRAFSPLIPGDVRNSSLPVALFVFHITNHSLQPVTASVALSWENTLGVGETRDGSAFDNRSEDTVTPIPDSDGYFGMHFAGSEQQAGATSGTFEGATGNMTLLAHPYRGSAVVTTASWNALDAKPIWWSSFDAAGVVSGSLSVEGGKCHPAGVVAVQVVLKSKDSINIPICVSWYTPVLRNSRGDDFGHYYQEFCTDSNQAARAALSDWQALLALTEEWQRSIGSSSLPPEVRSRVLDSASALVTNSILVRDGRFTMRESPTMPPSGQTYLQDRKNAAGLLLAMFPQLYAQEMVQLLELRKVTGDLSTNLSDWSARIGVALPQDGSDDEQGYPVDPTRQPHSPPTIVSATDATALRSTSEYIIQAAQMVDASNNMGYLRNAMPDIRAMILDFIRARAGGEGARSTGNSKGEQYSHLDLALWLEALRAGRHLAETAGSHTYEWAMLSGPLGNVPAGIIEAATIERFLAACNREISSLEAELAGQEAVANRFDERIELMAASLPETRTGLGGAIYWTLMDRLEGFEVDLTMGNLKLTTPIPGNWRFLTAPLFSATFYGRVEFKPSAHGGLLTIRIDRTIALSPIRGYRKRAGASGGTQLVLRTIRIAGPPPIVGKTSEPGRPVEVHASLGSNPIGCSQRIEPDGTLLLSFASPLTLLTGDLFKVEVN